jgi:hypothetical protein
MAKDRAVGVPETRFRSDVRPILFLDVDGVLLRRRHPGIFDAFDLAPGCLEFLEWATFRFRCFWLTSRARLGWQDGVRRAFRGAGAVLDDPRWAVLDLIKPAAWTIDKSEALDPNSGFWWADDAPTMQDRGWLRARGCEDRLIEINTDTNPDALMHLMGCWDRKYGRENPEK